MSIKPRLTPQQEGQLEKRLESDYEHDLPLESWGRLLASLPTMGRSYREPPAPLRSTDARPGTEEKIRVMAERARRGVGLYHPGDNRLPISPIAKQQGKES